jgi:hypothetical protein
MVEKILVETTTKGNWIKIPALNVNGTAVVFKGRWLKRASILHEQWLDSELEEPESCVKQLKEQRASGFRADIFSFTEKLPTSRPKYEYWLEWESLATIHITSYKDWWEKLPQETRKNVRRAQKRGVEVKVQKLDRELAEKIVEVNNDSRFRQNVPFDHYGKTVDQVMKDQSSFLDRSDFVCAYTENELIGFLKLVHRGELSTILQFVPRASQQDRRPANALIAKAVELCEAKGVSYLVYGLFNYGNKQDSSLREFKIRNGFEERLIPRYFIPLTAKGTLCIKFKLHRGLLGILPPKAIRMGVAARARWYDFERFMSRCSSMLERPNRNRQTECSNPPAGSNA